MIDPANIVELNLIDIATPNTFYHTIILRETSSGSIVTQYDFNYGSRDPAEILPLYEKHCLRAWDYFRHVLIKRYGAKGVNDVTQ